MEVMRRTKHLQVILLIICFLAFGSGCSSKNNPSVSEPIVSGTVETQPPTDTQQPVQNWDISQNHSAALIPGAYVLDEIPVPLRGIISSLSQKGTRALAVVSSFQQSGGQSDTLTVYDLSVKQAVWEMELEEGFTGAGFLSDGSVCAYWSSMEKLCVYGPEGQLLYIYDGIRLEGNPYIDDAQGIWLINGGELLHLCGGNKHTYPISFTGIAQTVVSVRSGRVLYACRQDSDCGAFADTVTGEQNWLPRMEGFSAGDGLFYKASEDRFLYSLDGEQIFSIPLLTEDEIIDAAVLGDQIVIRTLQKFYFLNLKTHSLAQLDGQAYYTGIFAGQTDALLLRLMTAQGEQVCSLTDYTEGQTDVSVTEQLLTPEQLRNREKAEAIEEMYGIYVRWLPQPAGTLASSGSRRSEGDQTDADIAEFLDSLDIALQQFPENLFRVITRDEVRCVVFSSLQGIVANNEDTVAESGAFVHSLSNEIFLVFSSTPDCLEELPNGTLAHELCHVLERALLIENPDADIFEEWSTLNPEDFSYTEDYAGYWGGWEYVFDYSGAGADTAYFISEYSKVNAKEDRATLFEEMCMPYPLMFRCPHIRAKADFLVQLLMEYYPELYENGDPIWLNYQKTEKE